MGTNPTHSIDTAVPSQTTLNLTNKTKQQISDCCKMQFSNFSYQRNKLYFVIITNSCIMGWNIKQNIYPCKMSSFIQAYAVSTLQTKIILYFLYNKWYVSLTQSVLCAPVVFYQTDSSVHYLPLNQRKYYSANFWSFHSFIHFHTPYFLGCVFQVTITFCLCDAFIILVTYKQTV